MSDQPSPLEIIQPPTSPKVDDADAEAQREWQRTGRVPMEYVQAQLARGLSSGQSLMDLILASVGSLMPAGGQTGNSSEG